MTTTNSTPTSDQPDHTDGPAKPDEVNPDTGATPDDIPIDNPSG